MKVHTCPPGSQYVCKLKFTASNMQHYTLCSCFNESWVTLATVCREAYLTHAWFVWGKNFQEILSIRTQKIEARRLIVLD
jgi:hypothetical protein